MERRGIIRFWTENSAYEVDSSLSLIRRLAGTGDLGASLDLELGAPERCKLLTYRAGVVAADGRPLHPDVFSQTFERRVAASALPRIRLHDLRHTHATLMIAAGVPVKVVSERLGHSSPAFTQTVYQHVVPGMQSDAAAAFSAQVFGALH
jgi:integrase